MLVMLNKIMGEDEYGNVFDMLTIKQAIQDTGMSPSQFSIRMRTVQLHNGSPDIPIDLAKVSNLDDPESTEDLLNKDGSSPRSMLFVIVNDRYQKFKEDYQAVSRKKKKIDQECA